MPGGAALPCCVPPRVPQCICRVLAGIELITAFYGCLYSGCVPVTVRPPHAQSLVATLPTVRMIVEVSDRGGASGSRGHKERGRSGAGSVTGSRGDTEVTLTVAGAWLLQPRAPGVTQLTSLVLSV